jgi:hypothetical protein
MDVPGVRKHMSVRLHRGGLGGALARRVGRRRAKRFKSEEASRAFDQALGDTSPSDRDTRTAYGSKGGVYVDGFVGCHQPSMNDISIFGGVVGDPGSLERSAE